MNTKYNKSHIIPDNTNNKTNTTTNTITSSSSIFRAPTQTYQTNPYIPMINVPTTTRLPSPGEIVASVELLTAHVSELSLKVDRIESRVNDWVNLGLAERMLIAERGIDALKTCHNDHDEKIARIKKEIDKNKDTDKDTDKDIQDLYERIRDLVDQNDDANKCLDRFSDILTIHTKKLRHAKHRSHNLTKKCAEIGILRRRVSKVEENNTENAEYFETTTELRGLLDNMTAQLREYKDKCEYLESMNACACMRFGCSNPHIEDLYRDLPSLEPIMCDENMELCEGTDLNAYFSNYWDNTNTEEKHEEKQQDCKTNNDIIINIDEEFAKYGDVSNDDEDNEDENDDDFEKL